MLVVDSSNPKVPIRSVTAADYFHLRLFYQGKECDQDKAQRLLRRLRNHWMICDCIKEAALDRAPGLTTVLHNNKLYLRNLAGRMDHSDSCPFRYEKFEGRSSSPILQQFTPLPATLNLLEQNLNTASGSPSSGTVNVTGKYSKFVRVFLTLIDQGGWNWYSDRYDYRANIKATLSASCGYEAWKGSPLNGFMFFSPNQLTKFAVAVKNSVSDLPYALGIFIVHEVAGNRLQRKDGFSIEPSKTEMIGEGDSGPYLSMVMLARDAGSNWVEEKSAAYLPVVSPTLPIPCLKSHYRPLITLLKDYIDFLNDNEDLGLTFKVPVFDLQNESVFYRPAAVIYQGEKQLNVFCQLADQELTLPDNLEDLSVKVIVSEHANLDDLHSEGWAKFLKRKIREWLNSQ